MNASIFANSTIATRFMTMQMNLSNITYTDEQCREACLSRVYSSYTSSFNQGMGLIGFSVFFMLIMCGIAMWKNKPEILYYAVLVNNIIILGGFLIIYLS